MILSVSGAFVSVCVCVRVCLCVHAHVHLCDYVAHVCMFISVHVGVNVPVSPSFFNLQREQKAEFKLQ